MIADRDILAAQDDVAPGLGGADVDVGRSCWAVVHEGEGPAPRLARRPRHRGEGRTEGRRLGVPRAPHPTGTGRCRGRARTRPGRAPNAGDSQPPGRCRPGCRSRDRRGRAGPARQGPPDKGRNRSDCRSTGAAPADTEPSEVALDRILIGPAAPCRVDVFQAEQQRSFQGGGQPLVGQRRIGVPEVEEAVRRRREPQDGAGPDRRVSRGGRPGLAYHRIELAPGVFPRGPSP